MNAHSARYLLSVSCRVRLVNSYKIFMHFERMEKVCVKPMKKLHVAALEFYCDSNLTLQLNLPCNVKFCKDDVELNTISERCYKTQSA